MDIVYLIVAVSLGTLRVLGVKAQFFKSIAHVCVGYTYGAGIYSDDKFVFWIAIDLTILEVICFAASRLRKGD